MKLKISHTRLLLVLIAASAICANAQSEPLNRIHFNEDFPQSVLLFSYDTGSFQCDKRTCMALKNAAKEMTFYSMGVEAIEKRVSRRLSSDPKTARKQAEAVLNSSDGERIAKALAEAYQARMLAQQMGVARLPAIVFDRQWIVYGVTELEEALQHYRKQRSKKVRGQQ